MQLKKKLMYYVVIFVSIVALVLLLSWYIKRGIGKGAGTQKKSQMTKAVNCPLCNSVLLVGEDLYSRVYRPMTVPDQRCTISGCPHCYPKCEEGVKRICPVCHKEVPVKDGQLIARLFNKSVGKKHVIIIGCSSCCGFHK